MILESKNYKWGLAFQCDICSKISNDNDSDKDYLNMLKTKQHKVRFKKCPKCNRHYCFDCGINKEKVTFICGHSFINFQCPICSTVQTS